MIEIKCIEQLLANSAWNMNAASSHLTVALASKIGHPMAGKHPRLTFYCFPCGKSTAGEPKDLKIPRPHTEERTYGASCTRAPEVRARGGMICGKFVEIQELPHASPGEIVRRVVQWPVTRCKGSFTLDVCPAQKPASHEGTK